MQTLSEQQKHRWLEEYACVQALYQVLNEGRDSLRVKRAEYHGDETLAAPLDFLLDVEIKAKCTLSEVYYFMFLRNPELIPEHLKKELGRVYVEYGLGPEGAYRTLFFRARNDQIRSYMKGVYNGINGTFSADGNDDIIA